MDRMLKKRSFWFVIGGLFVLPFLLVQLNESLGWYCGKLWTFGLELESFYKIWLGIWGLLGAMLTLYVNFQRLNKQSDQITNQNKQIANQDRQIANQDRQIAIQDKAERNNRFKNGIELLGNENDTVVIGAIYALDALARDFPEEYAKKVFDILCGYIRTDSVNKVFEKDGEDVIFPEKYQTIIDTLFWWDSLDEYVYKDLNGITFAPDFSRANLQNANFINCKLRRANFHKAFIVGTYFQNADLLKADFTGAHGHSAFFNNAKLQFSDFSQKSRINDNNSPSTFICAHFSKANLTGANLSSGQFAGAQFYKAKLIGAILQETNFTNSVLSGADLRAAKIHDLKIRGANVVDMDIRGADDLGYLDPKKICDNILNKVGKESDETLLNSNENSEENQAKNQSGLIEYLQNKNVAIKTIARIREALERGGLMNYSLIADRIKFGSYTKGDANVLVDEIKQIFTENYE